MQTYTFTIDFLNELLKDLGEAPAKHTFNIIAKIHQEVARQEAEKQATQETPKEE